eukprot:10505455-Lingulodinium_polyedra.AAC.1
MHPLPGIGADLCRYPRTRGCSVHTIASIVTIRPQVVHGATQPIPDANDVYSAWRGCGRSRCIASSPACLVYNP